MNWFRVSLEALAIPLVALLKLTFVLGLAWMAARSLAGKSAATRHSVWVAGVLAALLLPVVGWVAPIHYSGALGNAASHWVSQAAQMKLAGKAMASTGPAQALPTRRPSVLSVFALIWGLVSSLLALRLLIGFIRLSRIAVCYEVLEGLEWTDEIAELSRLLGVRRRVKVLLCREPAFLPVTWGVVRPRVMLPSGAEQWSAERRRIVLAHEIAHVSRHDWLLQMCAEIMCCIYWFHPLAWVAARRQRQESEHACDDAVLGLAIPALDYANELLELLQTLRNSVKQPAAALALVRVADLERRFEAMMAKQVSRDALSRKTKVLIAGVAGCLLLSVGAFHVPAQAATNEAPRGWFLAGNAPAEYTTGVDSTMLYKGHPSAFLKSKPEADKGFGTLMQTISAVQYAGHRVRLTAAVKSVDIQDWAGLWMRVDQGSSQVGFDNMQNRAIKGTTGWQEYSVVLSVPQQATAIAFGVLLAKSGAVWLSNVRFETVGDNVPVTGSANPNPPERPTNLGFEQ
jgi:beta-lactamase regulating signal transducer with metallopeptidase domain